MAEATEGGPLALDERERGGGRGLGAPLGGGWLDLRALFVDKLRAADLAAIDLAVLHAARMGVKVAPEADPDSGSCNSAPDEAVLSLPCPIEGCRKRFEFRRTSLAHMHTTDKLSDVYNVMVVMNECPY